MLAQLIKLLLNRRQDGWYNFALLTSSGGMPSSHTALVIATTTRIAVTQGIFSPLFGVCVVFSLVIMYDATGVRHSVGEQAQILNKIQEELKALIAFDPDAIKEVLGHTGIQVFIGLLIGLAVGLLSYFIPMT